MFRHSYIPPEILKNMEEPSKEGRILMGVLGSFAGAAVIMLVSVVLWLCDLRFGWDVEIGYFLLPLFIGYMAGWGYRLFRGIRSVPTAFIVVAGVTQLSSVIWLLGLFVFVAYDVTKASSLPFRFLYSSLTVLMPEFWKEYGDALLIYEILILVGVVVAGGALFRYADWKNTPWRMAAHAMKRQGHNLLTERLPYGTLPEQFRVGARLSIEGEIFRVSPHLKKEHSFTVWDIAGAVIGPSNGLNVLYGRNHQVLAKFAGCMRNSELLMKYLVENHIVMTWIRPDQRLIWREEPVTDFQDSLPKKFTLRMEPGTRKGFTAGGTFLILLGCSVLLYVIYLWITGAFDGDEATGITVSCIFVIPGLILAGMGFYLIGISKQQIDVDEGRIQAVTIWGRSHTFSAQDILSTSRAQGRLVLYDWEWKRIESLDLRLEGILMLEQYLRGGLQSGLTEFIPYIEFTGKENV